MSDEPKRKRRRLLWWASPSFWRWKVGYLWCDWTHPEWIAETPPDGWEWSRACPKCGRRRLGGYWIGDLAPGESVSVPLPIAAPPEGAP